MHGSEFVVDLEEKYKGFHLYQDTFPGKREPFMAGCDSARNPWVESAESLQALKVKLDRIS